MSTNIEERENVGGEHVGPDSGDENRYIIFHLGSEMYGARLLEVREVVESMPVKKVPNTISSFQGVSNLRGQIIGVVDLRSRFGIVATPPDRPIQFVFETETGAIAATVDELVSVSAIPPEDVEKKPNIAATIPMDYILGIAKFESHLVTLIDLRRMLSREELTLIHNSKILPKVG